MTQAKGSMSRLLVTELAESSYGVDPSSVHSINLPFNTLDMGQSRNLITPKTIRGRRDSVMPARGYVDLTGNAVVPVDKTAIGYWLKMLLGTPTTTSTGSAFSHVFQVNSVLGSFTMEKGFADIAAYEKLNGMKCGGMSMTVGGDDELTATFDLQGKGGAPSGSSMSSVISTLSLSRFNQFHASLLEGGGLVGNVRNCSINVNNNLDGDVYLITSGATGYRGDLPAGLINVSGDMEVLFENWSYYIYAFSGTERSLEIKFQEGSFYLDLKINELIYQQKSPPITTPGGIWLPMAYQAFFDNASPDQTIIQATLVNTWAAYSGHLAGGSF
jgi:hypothetical protein